MSVPPGQQPPLGDAPSPGYPPTGGQPTGYPPAGGQPTGYPPTGYPPAGAPGYYPAAPVPQKTAGVAIAGLILAFLFFPLGLVFSVIGLVVTGKDGKRGRGLAVAGLVISLAIGAGSVVVIAKLAKNITTIADPGCTHGKQVLLDNGDLGDGTDPTVLKAKLRTVITGLDAAAADAKHDNVRTAMKTLADDYRQLQTALNSGSTPPSDLESRATADGNRIDELCTIGGAQN